MVKTCACQAGARAAILCAVSLSIVIACLTSLPACLAALAIGLLFLAFSHPAISVIIARFTVVNFFILFLWLVTPWATPGTVMFEAGWPAISREGLNLCILATLKANAILAVFMAFLSSFTMAQLAGGLRACHCPGKLIWLFLLMERNVHLLRREWRRIGDAAKLRGFTPHTNWHSYKTIAAMLALLLIGAHDRGGRMHEAMSLRGFDGHCPFQYNSTFSIISAAYVLASIISIAAIALVEYHAP